MSTVVKFERPSTMRREIERLLGENDRLKLENAKLALKLEQAEKVAYLDPLMQIFNRYQLPWILEQAIERAKPGGRRKSVAMHFCLAFLDIDWFKSINDSYGHPVGDQALVLLANILKQNRRKLDSLIRYGGEEILVVLTNCNVKRAQVYLARLKKSLNAQFRIKVDQDEIRPTVSIGLAEWMPDMTQKELIKAADDALYRAKREGRDRICVA